ncbi:MAG: asparagine synthase (glutamine-hydrolyzing) [Verrucomicrobia bacterium]|jgi:asparagine synthase (glutamine-hydrolysing)|nr:asparagine synthase (glutamine-hydrolyzing) [Verrucomicrobiota bacterium]OQC66503.1 MAG: Asparagine synthetase (glutamine-hydrolyzing) 1 [Verrucomicrobia bacterium ADurb.Bin006]HPW15157.1 asparagine synthase (glutamine-hydrolyzing) [Nitrospira sp.]MDI9381964.1 asparagine synthase (glutamine-hydrolyzing) [Verrucomicrobiota bacterium]NMD20628.1 asparagine synthase (glutamine-hydrolyzing) [Verrucomicrobiota bacterium]
MCGIVGVFDRSGAPIVPGDIEAMLGALMHRGPDGHGRHIDNEIGLGHRRLSIIDLEGGAQPMTNEGGSLQIVFNGELYNYVELRRKLEAHGHQFRTKSDTEVIVHSYEQWGTECVTRFNGMFAFALWDSVHRTVFIARDHLGIKPLYFFESGTTMRFASEIKALLQHPSCPREVDLDSLLELFTFRYVPAPKTLFRHIYKLSPGHYMLCTREGVRVTRFWQWVPDAHSTEREAVLVEEYRALLEDAVRMQLRSDVPVGLFLSSGVDSAALLALMRKNLSDDIHAFTIDFTDGERTNEGSDAAEIARRFDCQHRTETISSKDYAQYYGRYMRDLEEPVGHEAAAAFFFVAQLARSRVKVALTGQGADEPWAGYNRYLGVRYLQFYSRLPRVVTDMMATLMTRIPGRLEMLKRAACALGEPEPLARFAKVYSYFNGDLKQRLFKGVLKTKYLAAPLPTAGRLGELFLDVRHLDPLSQMLYIDTRASLPDDLLMVADKTSMANSLEVRVPFLDYRLVEFVERLPPALKLKRLTAKYLHKRALQTWVPRATINRKKKGFTLPIASWMRTSMRPVVDDCLLSADSILREYCDMSVVRHMLERDRSGQDNFTRHIYLLLSLELWHRAFLRPGGTTATNAMSL